ncbi:MAG: hypothetical protein BRD30_03435 [Bacteroidetes bacterium QH_2_63_10]|nr:MAG: hypothetical protein BRD30_03435 [Bacteroidetes bacterium QH_2_63_10]
MGATGGSAMQVLRPLWGAPSSGSDGGEGRKEPPCLGAGAHPGEAAGLIGAVRCQVVQKGGD